MPTNSIQFRAGTWADKIYNLGKEVFEKSSNKEIAALIDCDNQGRVSQDRKVVAEKTGWKMPVGRSQSTPATTTTAQPTASTKPRKQAGSLPEKIEGFLVGLVEDVPGVWEPQHVSHVIESDSVAWNRFIRRMADLDSAMVESFERWLGRGATLNRQCAFDEIAEIGKQWDRKEKAESLARELIALGFGDKTPSAILREGWL